MGIWYKVKWIFVRYLVDLLDVASQAIRGKSSLSEDMSS